MIEYLRFRLWATLFIATLLLCGCTPASSNPKTYPITGTVTKGGKAVSGAQIVFVSVEQGGQSAFATTDNDGKYQLMTFEPNDGAMPGTYVIKVSKYEGGAAPSGGETRNLTPEEEEKLYNPDEKAPPPPKNGLPEKYASEVTSGLKHTVPTAASTFDIELK
ncbi:hypothetical protein VN12_23765 [Pirellula sp. SH-Sr6A]|uniref:carboxypeptidase-like regulatory domain-containing protein n=1 Tax=Pirellula sp. SH-Sr6A TaxID=1632865 RepID=UPI00078BD739|nr:carboxypeptidase-like regulatory domain-containing protein [Pirellula sp. SH-Sr6A]AMV35164.1 hypothetical protein VN12_23765 [Pirellula sp. SH-Sr6A]